MHYRKLGKTNFQVSEVSLGAWQIGAGWGDISNEDAIRVLNAAIENGVNFIDTADVYGDGRSERIIAQVLGDRKEEVFVATKAGRRLQPHVASGYNRDNLTSFVERSLQNLRRESLDLLQLHWHNELMLPNQSPFLQLPVELMARNHPPLISHLLQKVFLSHLTSQKRPSFGNEISSVGTILTSQMGRETGSDW